MEQAEEPKQPAVAALPEESTYGFVGRSYDILQLERAFRTSSVVLLKGMGGVGKTELSLGFARWLADTQGRDGGLFFTTFERGATLSNVVNDIGRQLGGDKFAALMPERQEQIVLQYLQTNSCLLIWDNFEPVAGFPAGNEPLLPLAERQRLQSFLKALRGGKSWVLISSRREEPWLNCGYKLLELRGLGQPDAEALAAKILQTAGVDRAKLPPEYLQLLTLLNGHPLSLRVVLPHLKNQSATNLLAALRNGLDTFAGDEQEGRESSLTVSLDYSFQSLSTQARQHLPFLSFFTERVDADWLHLFSNDADTPFGQAYRAVFGSNPSKNDWLQLLEEATAAGILRHVGNTIYQLHPTLPWYLRRVSLASADELSKLEAQLLTFYASLADFYRQRLVDKADLARFVLTMEEPNLLRFLRLSLHQQAWSEGQFLLQALGELYERINRRAEFAPLRQQALQRVGLHLDEVRLSGQTALNLWMYIRGNEANDALRNADLEAAKAIYQSILDELIALNDSQFDGKVAVAYHQLGMVAQAQRRFDEATAYYQKALKIKEAAGDHYKAASEYHQLGIVAYLQRRFDEATAYYQKALKIFEAAGDHYNAADTLAMLALLSKEQQNAEATIIHASKATSVFIQAEDQRKAMGMINLLAETLKEQGESKFQSLWQSATGEPCPDEFFKLIQKVSQAEQSEDS
ncbi:MAG: tetratricopeptide repeat protein [Cyanobacteria bacterium P01_D01_bin.128]